MGKAAKVKQNPAASKANGSVTSKPEAAAKPAAATNGKASKKDKKTKAVPVKEPTPESSSSDEDSDEEDSDEEDSDDSDDEDIKPVAAPAAKAANNAAANAKTAVTKTATQAKEAVKGKVNAAAKAVEATTAAAISSDDSSDEDSSSDEEESAAATTAAAVKDTAAKKGKQAVEATKTAVAKATEETSDSDDSDDSDDEEEAPKAGNKRSAEESGSDSDSDEDSDEEMEGAPETKKDSKPAAKKAKVDEDPNATNTVYVGGLSWGVDEAALKEYFSHYGDISSVRIITDSNSGKSKGFGYVDFVEKSSATASLELNETEWEGRTVKVNYSQPKADRGAAAGGAPKRVFNDELSAPSQTLFVGNLPFSATEDQVWEIFGEYGKVSSVRLPTDKEDGRPKGFGYVEFLSQEDASKACEAGRGAGLEIDGRQLRLDFSTPRPPREEGGFGGRGGGRGGFSDRGGSRGRGGFSDRGGSRGGRGRGGFSSDRGRGGGGAPRGRGGADGGWGGRGKAVRTGAALPSEGKKISFD